MLRQRLVTNVELQVEWIAQVKLKKKTWRDLSFRGLFKAGNRSLWIALTIIVKTPHTTFLQPDTDTWYYGCHGNDIQMAEDSYLSVLHILKCCTLIKNTETDRFSLVHRVLSYTWTEAYWVIELSLWFPGGNELSALWDWQHATT